MSARESIRDLKQRVGRSIIGQEQVVDRIVMGLLVNGNLLLEGLPGLAKTRAVTALARNLDAGLNRIQFTPDLLPSDITGSEVYHQSGGESEFRFREGPIFNNLILAEEINRAPAKVQAALLEAMEERTVTVGGKTRKLPPLFMVAATQNPIPQQAIFDARGEIREVKVSDAAEKYMVDLVFATRYPDRYSEQLAKWIEVGASPRGGLGLDRCSRAHAWLAGRDHVTPEDIRAVVHDVLRHRIMLSYQANAERKTSDEIIDEILELVEVP